MQLKTDKVATLFHHNYNGFDLVTREYGLKTLSLNIYIKMFQGIHNRLQNEKSRLATAIQACEAATASISRPTSPLEEIDGVGHKRELEAKLKLEDLIDQVR